MFPSASTHLLWLGLLVPALALGPSERCTQLARTSIKNAHSIKTLYLRANESYRIPASCGTADLRAQTSVNVCVVNVIYNTSKTSSTRIETWLPDANAWNGRTLGTGGGGFNGCVDYEDLKYGSLLQFATFGHDGGHDGESGAAFASDEKLVDWAHRSLHVATLTSKLLVKAYYGRAHDKSYYIGCSTAGRQGFRAVQDYPADFDGVLAGAPAINEIHLLGAGGIFNIAVHRLDKTAMSLVTNEVLRQCDGLDGLRDGIIDDPDACDFVPEVLLCSGKKRPDCLSVEQVNAVRTIYSPVYGRNGEKLAARFDPGAEGDTDVFPVVFDPPFLQWALDWWRYVVYKNSTWQPSPDFGLKEIADADKRDKQIPVATFNPNITAFQKRGGKLLSYHGTRDILIPHGNSLMYYQLVSRTLGLPPSKLDEFYRFFIIPGMNHCNRGPGAWMFGQIGFASWSNSSESNALLALVDWVERGNAPKTLRGAALDAAGTTISGTRLHCKYPARSIWREEKKDWVCTDAP